MRKANDNESISDGDEQYQELLNDKIFEEEAYIFNKISLNRRLLYLAFKIASSSFWWKFKSYKSKIKELNMTYQILNSIISSEENF